MPVDLSPLDQSTQSVIASYLDTISLVSSSDTSFLKSHFHYARSLKNLSDLTQRARQNQNNIKILRTIRRSIYKSIEIINPSSLKQEDTFLTHQARLTKKSEFLRRLICALNEVSRIELTALKKASHSINSKLINGINPLLDAVQISTLGVNSFVDLVQTSSFLEESFQHSETSKSLLDELFQALSEGEFKSELNRNGREEVIVEMAFHVGKENLELQENLISEAYSLLPHHKVKFISSLCARAYLEGVEQNNEWNNRILPAILGIIDSFHNNNPNNPNNPQWLRNQALKNRALMEFIFPTRFFLDFEHFDRNEGFEFKQKNSFLHFVKNPIKYLKFLKSIPKLDNENADIIVNKFETAMPTSAKEYSCMMERLAYRYLGNEPKIKKILMDYLSSNEFPPGFKIFTYIALARHFQKDDELRKLAQDFLNHEHDMFKRLFAEISELPSNYIIAIDDKRSAVCLQPSYINSVKNAIYFMNPALCDSSERVSSLDLNHLLYNKEEVSTAFERGYQANYFMALTCVLLSGLALKSAYDTMVDEAKFGNNVSIAATRSVCKTRFLIGLATILCTLLILVDPIDTH